MVVKDGTEPNKGFVVSFVISCNDGNETDVRFVHPSNIADTYRNVVATGNEILVNAVHPEKVYKKPSMVSNNGNETDIRLV